MSNNNYILSNKIQYSSESKLFHETVHKKKVTTLKCTPNVRQCDIMFNRRGAFQSAVFIFAFIIIFLNLTDIYV